MSHENVIDLGSGVVLGDAANDVVRRLERLLDQARSGEVVGAAVAVTHADGASSFEWSGQARHSTLGALVRMQAHIMKAMGEC